MHLRYVVGNAPLQSYPFPHMYVRNVFPPDFYSTLLVRIPAREHLTRGADDSAERWSLPLEAGALSKLDEPARGFWTETAGWLLADDLLEFLLDIFEPFMPARSKSGLEGYRREALLVRDHQGSAAAPAAGPEDDALTMLFYLPRDESRPHLGTGIYVPQTSGALQCACTMPFVPNSMFAFVRTAGSFHGFGAVAATEPARDVLRYDLRLQD